MKFGTKSRYLRLYRWLGARREKEYAKERYKAPEPTDICTLVQMYWWGFWWLLGTGVGVVLLLFVAAAILFVAGAFLFIVAKSLLIMLMHWGSKQAVAIATVYGVIILGISVVWLMIWAYVSVYNSKFGIWWRKVLEPKYKEPAVKASKKAKTKGPSLFAFLAAWHESAHEKFCILIEEVSE